MKNPVEGRIEEEVSIMKASSSQEEEAGQIRVEAAKLDIADGHEFRIEQIQGKAGCLTAKQSGDLNQLCTKPMEHAVAGSAEMDSSVTIQQMEVDQGIGKHRAKAECSRLMKD